MFLANLLFLVSQSSFTYESSPSSSSSDHLINTSRLNTSTILSICSLALLKYRDYAITLMNVKSILGVIIGITFVTITLSMTTPMLLLQQAEAFTIPGVGKSEPKAPMVASGDNLYIVWWTNYFLFAPFSKD